jgi:hypothetical protein
MRALAPVTFTLRAGLVGCIAGRDAIIRLLGAGLVEKNDECIESRCHPRRCSGGTGAERGGGMKINPQVRDLGWVSRPVGRVLCPRLRGAAVIHLGLPLPAASCGLPASIGRAALERSRREPRFPSWPCSGWGLPSRRSHLRRWWSLTPPFHPYPRASAKAVCFLWHCPAGHPGSALPTTLPCGARTFLTGPNGPARPPGRLTHGQDTRTGASPGVGHDGPLP